eukprot:2068439-Pleurochrysis_carterae.AAC.4
MTLACLVMQFFMPREAQKCQQQHVTLVKRFLNVPSPSQCELSTSCNQSSRSNLPVLLPRSPSRPTPTSMTLRAGCFGGCSRLQRAKPGRARWVRGGAGSAPRLAATSAAQATAHHPQRGAGLYFAVCGDTCCSSFAIRP